MAFIARLGHTVGGDRLGIIALATGAFSPFLVYYAQAARMYAPALVGASGSMALFAILIKKQQHGRQQPRHLWVLYAILSLVGVYSHYYAFIILLAQAAYLILPAIFARTWNQVKPWLTTWLLMALAFAPWIFIHLRYLDNKASSRYEEWTAAKFAEIVRRTLVAYGAGITMPATDAWRGWVVSGLALLGLFSLLYHAKERRLGTLLGLALLIAGLFAWIMNPIMPFFYERYLLIGMPPFIVLLSAGLVALLRAWKPAAVNF